MQTASLTDKFHALADQTRFQIICRLAKGSATVGELSQPFAISKPAISRHLRVLESSGFIEREIQAQSRVIRLKRDAVVPIKAWVKDMERFWQDSFDALENFLQEEENQNGTNSPGKHANNNENINGN